MLWVVQDNLYNEAGYVRFIEALKRFGSNYIVVKPVPFTNRLLKEDFDSTKDDFETAEEPFIDLAQKIVIMGATSLSRISKHKGWIPGTFLNDNFDFSVWRDGFGAENILNPESVVTKIGDSFDISNLSDEVFVRPVHDSKAFNGTVMCKQEFINWCEAIGKIEEVEFQPLHKNTIIAIADVKKIYAEYRFFVIDGIVVTGSMYKRGGVTFQTSDIDKDVWKFADRMTRTWFETDITLSTRSSVAPAKAYVIDVADTENGFKVIEINNINSAGFYACDVQKIIIAMEDLIR